MRNREGDADPVMATNGKPVLSTGYMYTYTQYDGDSEEQGDK